MSTKWYEDFARMAASTETLASIETFNENLIICQGETWCCIYKQKAYSVTFTPKRVAVCS